MGPKFVGGRDTPYFRHAFLNYTYFHVAEYGLVPFSELRDERVKKERKKKEEEKSLVKYKSADILCRAA